MQWLRHKTCWGSAFSHALPKHLFFGFALFLLVFSGFLKQRFGIFQAAVSQWLGHKTCWGSAFRMRSPSTFFLGFALFVVGSKSNVSAFFWLRFRMAWARFLCVFNGFRKQRFGIFPAAVSQWLGHKTCCHKSLLNFHQVTISDMSPNCFTTLGKCLARNLVVLPSQNACGEFAHEEGSAAWAVALNPAMHKASDAGHIGPHGMRRCLSFSYRGRRHVPPTRPRRHKNGSFLKSVRCA